MNNNVLVMREEELEIFVGGLKNAQAQFEDTAQDIPRRLGYMKRSNLFSNGIDKISRQTNSISNSILNIGWMMQEHNSNFFNIERNLAKAASKIEIPLIGELNDNLTVNNVVSVTLEKGDGRSVNEGHALEKIDDVKDSSITREQPLENITSSLNLKEEKLDENTVISREELGNINNENGKQLQEIDGNTSLSKQDIGNINNENGKQLQEIDGNTSLSKQDIGNINNNVSQTEQEINMSTNIVANNLQKINNYNMLGKEAKLELDDDKLNQINDLISDINSNNDNLKSFGDLNDNAFKTEGV